MAVKKDTTIDHKERLNRVLIYIQENINSQMSLETLSGVAFFSPFHFHRIFKAFVGETVNDYIRRIRLEHAALKLSYSYEPITSIALASGYETPSAFTKAFRQHFGKNPTDFRDSRKISLSLSNNLLHLNNTNIEVKTTMTAAIRMLPEQKILFVKKTGRYEKAASEAWAVLMEFTYSHRLIERDTRIIGVSLDNPEITSESKLRYDACISSTKDIKPEGEINVRKLSGGKYAVFLHKGPYDRLGKTYDAIFGRWLPANGEKLRDVPCSEVYLSRNPGRTKSENLKTEIYVPLE